MPDHQESEHGNSPDHSGCDGQVPARPVSKPAEVVDGCSPYDRGGEAQSTQLQRFSQPAQAKPGEEHPSRNSSPNFEARLGE